MIYNTTIVYVIAVDIFRIKAKRILSSLLLLFLYLSTYYVCLDSEIRMMKTF